MPSTAPAFDSIHFSEVVPAPYESAGYASSSSETLGSRPQYPQQVLFSLHSPCVLLTRLHDVQNLIPFSSLCMPQCQVLAQMDPGDIPFQSGAF